MDDLSKLARQERAKLVPQTTKSGNVSKEDFEALDRLDKLAAADRSCRQWLIPACAFLVPLAIVTLLIKTEKRETQIDIDANVSAFSATLRRKQPLFDGSLLRTLNATGLEGVNNLPAGDEDCSVGIKRHVG